MRTLTLQWSDFHGEHSEAFPEREARRRLSHFVDVRQPCRIVDTARGNQIGCCYAGAAGWEWYYELSPAEIGPHRPMIRLNQMKPNESKAKETNQNVEVENLSRYVAARLAVVKGQPGDVTR